MRKKIIIFILVAAAAWLLGRWIVPAVFKALFL